MSYLENLQILSERVILERDKGDPTIGHVKKVIYIAGTHLEVPGGRPHQGWTGDETVVEDEYIPKDPIRIRGNGLLWTCAWHDPYPPLPEGYSGYTHGICKDGKEAIERKLQARKQE